MAMSQGAQDQEEQGGRDGGKPTHARTLALLVKGRNINEETLLATDYLNHFNEIVMILDLVPDMPECLEDAREWTAKSYVEHFRESTFTDKELAVFAYENSPAEYRVPFDDTVKQIHQIIEDGLKDVERVAKTGDVELIRHVSGNVSHKVQRFIDMASAIIHGDARTMDQAEIDSILDT